jgi:DNA-binding beta-propeller fold protein YncE
MRRGVKRQVDPRVAGIAIFLALAAVQYFWWQGLVARHKTEGRGGGGGGGARPADVTVLGDPDALVYTVAGAPDPGSGDGLGRNARFDGPCGLALDRDGSLYVADCRNHRIRRVARDGRVSTVAGSDQGYADGPAAEARFSLPTAVALGAPGELFVADTGNNRIRRIAAGEVRTVAARGAALNRPCALAYLGGADPELLVSDASRRLWTLHPSPKSPAGGELRAASSERLPWVATSVGPGAQRLLAGPDPGAVSAGARSMSDIIVDLNGQGRSLRPGQLRLLHPTSACAAREGWFVTDAEQCALFLVLDAQARVIAGPCRFGEPLAGFADGPGNRAQFGPLTAAVFDGIDNVYVCDPENNAIRRITLTAPPPVAPMPGFGM